MKFIQNATYRLSMQQKGVYQGFDENEKKHIFVDDYNDAVYALTSDQVLIFKDHIRRVY